MHWLDRPEEHDFPAAADYLDLLFTPADYVEDLVEQFRSAPVVRKKAKDILRASGLVLLPEDNDHVAADLRKIEKGRALSPVLLVRGEPLVIADGYHRVCACYHTDENSVVAVVLV